MDMNENNNFGSKKSHGNHLRTHSSGVSAGWQFNSQAMSAVPGPANASIVAGLATPVSFSPYPSAQMVENHHNNSPNKGVGENNIPSTAGTTNYISIAKPVAMSSTRILLPAAENFPSTLPHFATDLAFIEQEARFSCFGGGNFSGTNLFGPSLPLASSTNALKDVMGAQLPKTDVNAIVSSTDRSPIQNQRDWRSSHIGTSCEAKFTEGGQEGKTNSADASGNSSPSNVSANKRRRTIQDMEQNQVQRGPQSSSETTKEKTEAKQKVEHNSSKHVVKGRKDNLEAAREDYVHVRARRGQATNNHSLAERIRREKISERMRYLQELVPGCSKVTGKAVMLDEIINYVQSLQRQVEFLSMKLAAVNPQLDFGVEGVVCKNIPQSHGGSSSGTAFSPDMIYSQVYPSQQGMAHVGISAVVNPSDAFRRANTQLSTTSRYKESSLKVHNPWNGEHAMQMTYGANPPSVQEIVDKPHGFTI